MADEWEGFEEVEVEEPKIESSGEWEGFESVQDPKYALVSDTPRPPEIQAQLNQTFPSEPKSEPESLPLNGDLKRRINEYAKKVYSGQLKPPDDLEEAYDYLFGNFAVSSNLGPEEYQSYKAAFKPNALGELHNRFRLERAEAKFKEMERQNYEEAIRAQGGSTLGPLVAGFAAGGGRLTSLLQSREDSRATTADVGQLEAAASEVEKESILPGAKHFRGAISSLTTSLPGIAASIAGGGPAALIAYAALQSGDEAYNQALNQGMNPEDAKRYALINGLIEGGITGAFQAIGAGGFESLIRPGMKEATKAGLKELAKRFGKSALEELPEEVLITIGQALNSKYSGLDPKAIENLPEAVTDTIVQTLLLVGAGQTVPELARGKPEVSNIQNIAEEFQIKASKIKDVLGQEFAAWANQNPEAAQQLSEIENPSRSDFEKANVPGRYTAEQRSEITKTLRDFNEQEQKQLTEVTNAERTTRQVGEGGGEEGIQGQAEGSLRLRNPEQNREEVQQGQAINEPVLEKQPEPVKYPEEPVKTEAYGSGFGGGPVNVYPSQGVKIDQGPNKGILRSSIDAFKKYLGKGQNADVFDENLLRKGDINARTTDIRVNERIAKQAIGEELGHTILTNSEKDQLNAALSGRAPLYSVPQKIGEALGRMRAHLKSLSSEMIRSGAVQGPLVEVFNKNMETWLHRSYNVFHDPYHRQKVHPETINKAAAAIRAEYPGLTEEQIQGKINFYLNPKAMGAKSVLDFAGKLGSKDLSIVSKRGEISSWLRELWGEENDPIVNYVRSASMQSQFIANHNFLSALKDKGLGKYFFNKPTSEFIYPVAGKESKTYSPLAPLYTNKETADELNKVLNPKPIDNPVFRGYLKMMYMVKAGKTVFNFPAGFVRNFVANPWHAMMQGHFSPQHGWTSMKALVSDALAKEGPGLDLIKEMQRHGVLDQSIEGAELREVARDLALEDKGVLDHLLGPKKRFDIREFGQGINKLASRTWNSLDNFFKIHGWLIEKDRYRKAHPEWSEEQLNTIAADRVNSAYPNYEFIGKGIKALRNLGIYGTFTSYPSEVIRTQAQTGRVIAEDFKDPRTRLIGAQRLAGSVAAYTLPYVLAGLARSLSGVRKDEEDALRESMADYHRNSILLPLGRAANGKDIRYMDLSALMPQQYILDPIMAGARAATGQATAKEAFTLAAKPWLDENIMASVVADYWRNKKRTGGQIYNEQDTWKGQTDDVMNYVWDRLGPQAVINANKLSRAITGQVDKRGKIPRVDDSIMGIVGLRPQETDTLQSLTFSGMAYSKDTQEANRKIRDVLKDKRSSITSRDIIAAKAVTEMSRQQLFDRMVRQIDGAAKLGFSVKEIEKQLKDAGVGKEEIAKLFASDYKPYVPKEPDFLDKIINALEDDPAQITDPWVAGQPRDAGPFKAELIEQIGNRLHTLTLGRPVREKKESLEKFQGRLQDYNNKQEELKEFFKTRNISKEEARKIIYEEARQRKEKTNIYYNGKLTTFGKRLKKLDQLFD